MNHATISILIAFALYTTICWAMFGPLPSLSATYYLWKRRDYSAAWSIFSAVVFVLCCVQTVYPYQALTKLLFPLTGFMIWALTVASTYKDRPVLHYIPTILSIVLGFVCVYVEFGVGYKLATAIGVFIATALLLKALKVDNATTWIELSAVICILFWFIAV